jgi:hypothetical protein
MAGTRWGSWDTVLQTGKSRVRFQPIPLAERFKATICGRSLAVVTDSNPAGNIHVCAVLCDVKIKGKMQNSQDASTDKLQRKNKRIKTIPGGVVLILHWLNPSGRTMTLGSTQPLTEMSTRDISGGQGGRCVGLTILPPLCADCLKILGTSNSCSSKGLSRPVMEYLYLFTSYTLTSSDNEHTNINFLNFYTLYIVLGQWIHKH